MENSNKHMDNKLRQLENQSLPDLSRQDEHWQEMKQMLQPAVIPVSSSKRSIKKIWWVVAACFFGVLLFVGYKTLFPSTNKKTSGSAIVTAPVKNGADQVKKVPDGPIVVSPVTEQTTKKVNPKRSDVTSRTKQKPGKQILENETVFVDTTTRDVAVVDNKPKLTLEDFFKQLEKREQEFIIDPKKDTVVRGKDGSALFFAAGTFNSNEPVTIVLKEYYSYEDIVTNKLTTFSNGRQLITGGMIHLSAIANGKEISMAQNKSIRWFIPDTSSAMAEMQVFKGQVKKENWMARIYSDGEGGNTSWVWADDINWLPQDRNFNNNFLYTSVKVLDIRDNPYRSRETKKGVVGKFHIDPDPKISKEEMEKILKEKYGYYKVKIKTTEGKRAYRKSLFGRSYTSKWETTEELGDSAWVDIKVARTHRLAAKDTIVSRTPAPSTNRYDYMFGSRKNWDTKKLSLSAVDSILIKSAKTTGNTQTDAAFTDKNLNDLAKKYSVDVRNLGWINCDRFMNDGRPKVDFYVDLSDTATNYYTLLVFDNIRSMMTGQVNGNRVVFRNVPSGAKAKVISLTIKDGKPSSAMETVVLSKSTLSGLKFEETTPAEFKEQAAGLDK